MFNKNLPYFNPTFSYLIFCAIEKKMKNSNSFNNPLQSLKHSRGSFIRAFEYWEHSNNRIVMIILSASVGPVAWITQCRQGGANYNGQIENNFVSGYLRRKNIIHIMKLRSLTTEQKNYCCTGWNRHLKRKRGTKASRHL